MRRFELVLLNTVAHTHLCLGPGTSSALDLNFCSPGLAVNFDWLVLPHLHGSEIAHHYSIPNGVEWVTRHTDWAGFSQTLIFEDQHFPSLDCMMEYFTSTVLRAAAHFIPQSSTIPRRTSVPWLVAEYRDALRSRRRKLT